MPLGGLPCNREESLLMRILHIVEGLGKASGVTTFIENVAREQHALGHNVSVITNANVTSFTTTLTTNHQPLTTLFHIHGLWSPLLHRATRFACNHNIPGVWSTHGMTAPWSLHHKWWKKCLPWYLYQRNDLHRVALIHCTTDLEAEWNHALGFTNTFIAPLGTTLPKIDNNSAVDLLSPSRPKQRRTLLYVGRVYPVKALDNAIRAIALMKHPITLRIVGPDQAGHMAELMSLSEQLHLRYTKPDDENSIVRPPTFNLQPLIQFIGPKYDNDLSTEYDNCDGLILVSHTENFGATVIDALAHGKPVITSTNTPWKVVVDKHCGWWVENNPHALANTFDEFASTANSEINLLGQNGRLLVEQQYTWPAIARNLISNYERIICHA